MTPYFSFVLTERPLFSLFSLSPKDPYFGGRVRTYPSLPYVSAPPRSLHVPALKFLSSAHHISRFSVNTDFPY